MKIRDYRTTYQRRKALEKELKIELPNIGAYTLDEKEASTRNCENMIGVAQVPMGIAGPLKIKNQKSKIKSYHIPLATMEGALVASVNRGCKAISESGGAFVNSHRIGATRGPVFFTGSTIKNEQFYLWLKENEEKLVEVAKKTSQHLTLKKIKVSTLGRHAFVRFYFDTQDAMGMNMATKATQSLVNYIEDEARVKCISLAGNFDIDKKPAWLNVIENRGIKVWAEVAIPAKILKQTLKTSAQAVYDVWLAKCMLGSAMSGSMGFNAQFANVVAALFLATGQDPAHVVEGSLGVTTTEVVREKSKEALYVSVYLPSLMVGTIGGGTGLATQKEALTMLGVAGGNQGKNAQKFAEIVGTAVLAGEISLLASLSEGSLSKAHEKLGRGKTITK